ncbi:MAG TPA: hypothetical protein VF596_04795 [Pyrinomonadaceae bacterium]
MPIEAISTATAARLPLSLQTATTPVYYKSLILRLLTGTIDIECQKTGRVIQQRNNYSTLVYTPNRRAYKRILESAIPCSLSDYDRHTRATLRHNLSLYRDIYFEFCGYFYLRDIENELGAFVHLYRVLERIAYCLPLMWAAKAQDYKKTFDTLKKYFSEPKIGELKVLKKFITDFIDVTERHTHATLNITSIHADWQSRYYRAIYEIVRDWDSLVSSTPDTQIIVHFEAILNLAIIIRNNYFHALTGQAESFDSEQIIDNNEFFAIFNENLVNWLAFLIFQIFENELERL